VVWQALLDPEVLAKTMPGCERLERISDNEYKGVLKIRVGPVQGQFEGIVTITDLDPPQGYHMQVNGKGAPGFIKGEGTVRLEEENSSTLMYYSGTAQVGGRIASVGQRLLDSSAKALTRQSLEGLDNQIKVRTQIGSSAESIAEIEQPSQIQFALGATRHVLDDLIPAERRPVLISTGLAILASLFIFRLLAVWSINRLAHRVADIVIERRCNE
jgi:carbon monoxide dehydrogenase subunit G